MWVAYIGARGEPFDLEKIDEGELNHERPDKPKGGLWTSPVFCHYPWHTWCENEAPAWKLDRYTALLQVEGTFLYLDSRQAFRHINVLDFDGLIYSEYDSNVSFWDRHDDYWSWSCDTVWLKSRSCIKGGMIIPTKQYNLLLEANRLAYPGFVVPNPLDVDLRDVLSKLIT